MKEEELIVAALQQARLNMSQAAFDEDYAEASVWQIKIEALEDLQQEIFELKRADELVQAQGFNVVNING